MTDVALDACCLINLHAAGCVLTKPIVSPKKAKGAISPDELPSLGWVLRIPAIVASESLYILQPDHDDPTTLVKTPMDVSSYFTSGILHPCDVEGESEMGSFVSFASRVDDGEAVCLALAKNRSWIFATDDRLAANIAGQQGITVVTTAEILQRWAVNTSALQSEIATAIQNIQRFAKFIPRPDASGAAWWFSNMRI